MNYQAKQAGVRKTIFNDTNNMLIKIRQEGIQYDRVDYNIVMPRSKQQTRLRQGFEKSGMYALQVRPTVLTSKQQTTFVSTTT